MPIHLWGTDFRRSSAEFRSKLFIPEEERSNKLREFRFERHGVIYLHTCNRVEFYTTARDPFQDSQEFWKELLVKLGLEESDFYQGYHLEGKSALRHLLRVASSLESMVVGESQILGQLKEARSWSQQNEFCQGGAFDRAFRLAFETAKKIRTETNIGSKPVSVATIAAKKVESLVDQHPLEKVVVVGRSPMILSTVRWLKKFSPECPILWVNRSPDKLDEVEDAKGVERMALEDFLARPVPFSHLFTATSSQSALFTRQFLEAHATGSVVVDFAQPPDTETFEGGTLIRIAGLNDEAEKNRDVRKSQLFRANEIIETSLRDYYLEQKEQPILREFSRVERVLMAELGEALNHIRSKVSDQEIEKIESWAEKLVRKNVHASRQHLREVIRTLSGVDDDKDEDAVA